MHSCLYEGHVLHHRRAPKRHAFRIGMYMSYLDLDELDGVFDGSWLWSADRPAPSWFRRGDYLDPDTPSLDTAVRDRVEALGGRRPNGPIRLLTQLRTWGYCFNPVSFYYLFDDAGERAERVLAEITNTPWKERHAYLVPVGEEARFGKRFHVSPFMPMQQQYRWRLDEPGEELRVHMENHRDGERVFEDPEYRRLVRLKQTLGVIARIHLQALQLWRKRVPFYPHPSKVSS